MMERGEGSNATSSKDKRYQDWKSVVPILYDRFTNHNLVWPSLSCRWGPQFEQGTNKNCQRLYLSEETASGIPDTLLITNCDVVKPGVAIADDFGQVNEESNSIVKVNKTLIHPGQVTRIKELPQNSNIVATHTDNNPDVFIWNSETQPNKFSIPGVSMSSPDLTLVGHSQEAERALAMCLSEPFVLSGGQDKSVLMWSLSDSGTVLELSSSKLTPRRVFRGHDATVVDIQFRPSSTQEFCSVGEDYCLILWDARAGYTPVVKVEKAHDCHLKCVDWNAQNENLILTGSADQTVRLFDRRNLTAGGVASPIRKFEGHVAPVTTVQWCPDRASVFASAAKDKILNIWDHHKVGNNNENTGLVFHHAGHDPRDEKMDFHWNPTEPWTIASISNATRADDSDDIRYKCTLQIWRIKRP